MWPVVRPSVLKPSAWIGSMAGLMVERQPPAKQSRSRLARSRRFVFFRPVPCGRSSVAYQGIPTRSFFSTNKFVRRRRPQGNEDRMDGSCRER
jgi:hypothetical protein